MGQYYICVNISKQEFLYPHSHKTFSKLMEHSWVGNSLLFAVDYLLIPGQSWYKSRIVWAGDYMDARIFLPENEPNKEQTLYAFAMDHFCERTVDAYEALSGVYLRQTVAKTLESCDKEEINYILIDEFNKEFRFILNHAKKEFVDKLKCPACSDGWIIHPLSLLTSSGNGRGGGDYRGKSDYVGTWAGDVISVESELPTGFKEIQPNFIE